LILAIGYAAITRADPHQAQQHPVPDADRADLSQRPRSVILFSVCGHLTRIYFVTSDGRQVQFRGPQQNPSNFSAEEIVKAVLGAALFDAMDVQGPFCPSPEKPRREGVTDL
jgi:hypothetical protein